ncbi:unnamed protein product [Closterium sp. NIES-53]
MASLRVLAFDHEGRPVQFDTWQDNLQLYLLSDSKDSVSLFDLASGAVTAPPATADSSTCSQTAQALYDAVVARYSSFATALLGRLLLPYLFPELSAFTTVEDLVSHLRASDARYRAAIPAEDHFLSLDATSLTIDLLEQHLLAAETSAVAVGAARGTPRPPFFEGCSPSPLAPSYDSAAAADVPVAEDVGAASASAKHRYNKGKGGRVGGGGSGGGGGGSGSGGGGSSVGGGGGATVGGSGGSGGGGGGSGGSGGNGGGGTGSGGTGARHVGCGGGQRQQQQRRSETPSPQQLRAWFLRGASGGSCSYVIRTGDHAGQTCRRPHTQHHCFSHLDDAWRAEFGDDVELSRWADLLKSRIAIFYLDFDAILSAMYALSVSIEGDFYRCVPPDPGIAAAALGASESVTVPAEALHTFTLDSGASRCFFWTAPPSLLFLHLSRSEWLTPLGDRSWPVPPLSSRVLWFRPAHCQVFTSPRSPLWSAALQDLMVITTTPGGQRVSICTCTRMGRHLATFTRRPGSRLYTLTTEPSQVAASAQVSESGQVAASCSCRLLSHQTLLWHHRLGHPSLPRLRGMHSRLLVCGLPRSLPPLPPSPAPPCLPCVEGRQRAAPHSSLFPPTSAPQDVTFDKSVPFYRLFPYRSAPPLPPPLFLAPGPPPVDPLPPEGPATSGVSQVDPLPSPAPVQVAVDSGAAPGAASGGAKPGGAESEGAVTGGAEPWGVETGGAEPQGVEPGGAELGGAASEGAESGSAEPQGAASSGGSSGTTFLQGSQHEEIWLRRPPGFTESFPAGTKWSLRRPVYGLRQVPCEWHDTLRTTLAALGFAPATANPSLFLRIDTSLLPFYVLVYFDDLVFAPGDTEALTLVLQRFVFQFSSPQPTPLSTSHSLSAPPSDESVEPSGPYPELVGCLMYLMTCTRPDLAYPLSLLARYVAPSRHQEVHWDTAKRVLRYLCSTSGMGLVLGGRGPVVLTGHAGASWVDESATQRSSQGYTFSLGSGSVSWRSTLSSSVLSFICEAEIYAGAMAAQELRWLTYPLTDLGERPRSTQLQKRGQLRLAYGATRANTADVFTKALPHGDHQRFSTVLGLLAFLVLTGLVTTCFPPLCLWGCVKT